MRSFLTVGSLSTVVRAFSGDSLPDPAQEVKALVYSNPLVPLRADPSVYRHSDGYYYLTATVPNYNLIEVRRATSLQGLKYAAPTTIWTAHASGIMANNVWAPEIHWLDGKWYIYFAAGSSADQWAIRMYVLEGTGANPLAATWTEKGEIAPGTTTMSLDATVFEAGGTRYLVWAQYSYDVDTAGASNLSIAKMETPWSLATAPVIIARPVYDWERVTYRVNEAPAALLRNGRVFLAYSASATDQNYCMGLLTASLGSDLTDPASWTKSPTPVFQTNASRLVYGPGHCSFTTEAGQDVMVYHARRSDVLTNTDPLLDPHRAVMAKTIGWNPDGTPNFGVPR